MTQGEEVDVKKQQEAAVTSGRRKKKGGSRSPGHHHHTLVANTSGRLVFFGLLLLLIVSISLSIIGIWPKENRHWAGIGAIGIITAGLLHTAVAATSAAVFRFRRTNFVVFTCFAIGGLVMEGLLIMAKEGKEAKPIPISPLLHTGIIMGSVLMLMIGIILLLPETMSISGTLHPFAGKERKKSTESHENKAGKANKTVRTFSYEDWPDPIPFPAKALYTFTTSSTSELPFQKGSHLIITGCRGNWWQAKCVGDDSRTGFIPSNFVQVMQKAKITKRYLATSEDEVSVLEGQTVELMEHHEFASLIRTVEGNIGSVPTSCLEPIPDPALEKLKI